jgi:prepilin peptidase CpaA
VFIAPVTKVVLLALVLVAAIYDLRERRIPNWLVLAGLILGFGLNAFLFEWAGLRLAAFGMGLAFVIYFPLYAIRGMGAGDVKLMAAIGSLVGPVAWVVIFLFTAILGGLLALILVFSKGRVRKTFANLAFMLREMACFRPPYARNEELDVKHAKAVGLPHAVSIAVGSGVFLAGLATWSGLIR